MMSMPAKRNLHFNMEQCDDGQYVVTVQTRDEFLELSKTENLPKSQGLTLQQAVDFILYVATDPRFSKPKTGSSAAQAFKEMMHSNGISQR